MLIGGPYCFCERLGAGPKQTAVGLDPVQGAYLPLRWRERGLSRLGVE